MPLKFSFIFKKHKNIDFHTNITSQFFNISWWNVLSRFEGMICPLATTSHFLTALNISPPYDILKKGSNFGSKNM